MLFNLLKARSVTLVAGLLLLLALPFFFISGPAAYSTALFRALWDCGHLLFFAGLVVALNTAIDFSKVRAGILLTLAVVIVGGLIELVQSYTGRDGSWQDLLRDLAGTWLGLFWVQKASVQIWLGRIFAVLLLLPTLVPVYTAAQVQHRAEQKFPLLADFETEVDLHSALGKVERSNTYHSRGNFSLKVQLTAEKYSRVALVNFFNSWQGYSALLFDIYNPEPQPMDLQLRIDDVQHLMGDNLHSDRFNHSLHLEPGWNAITISVAEIQHAPATRLLQLDAINSIIIYAVQLPSEQSIYLDNLRLQ